MILENSGLSTQHPKPAVFFLKYNKMINNIKNINSLSKAKNMLQTVEIDKIETYLKQNKNSKLLVLSLDDLNADLLKQLQEKQCRMLILNEQFKIVEETKPKQIQLTINGVRQSVALENIIRLEACSNYTQFYLNNSAKPVLTSKTLKYYTGKLDEHRFFRPHQSHLLNKDFVETFDTKLRTIFLKDGSKTKVARRKLSQIKRLLSTE